MTPNKTASSALSLSLALWLAGAAGCHGCHGCGRNNDLPLASLFELRGDSARRDYARSREHWERVDPRAVFRLGDGLRTDPPSSAVLNLAGGGQLQVRTGTVIRFLVDGADDDEQAIDVLTGEALLISGQDAMRLRTHVGVAVLTAGSQLLLTRTGNQLRLELEVGEASFRHDRGETVKLKVGEGVMLEVGAAVMRQAVDAAVRAEPAPALEPETIVRVQDDGVRARQVGEREWRALARGEHVLAKGTGLRLAAGTQVELARGRDRAGLRGAGEFVLGEGATLVTAQRGDLRLTAVERDLELVVPGGRIIVHAAAGGSNAAVHVSDAEGTVDVENGSATFKGEHTTQEVTPGTPYHWSFAALARAASDEAEIAEGPDYANFEISAGESFVVHTPEVPVALSFEFARKCKAEAVVELVQGHQRARGVGHANLSLPAGARAYTVRCLDARGVPGSVVLRGNAQVLHDSGTRRLPPVAPTSEIEADGRSYTIFYQNQLPNIRLRWPNAPSVESYRLEVDGTAMSVHSPEHLFPSGTLGDGTHRLNFEAEGRRSRTADVTVRFDNTAATASLSAPADRGFRPGDTVKIEGVALPAWKVSLQGGTIESVGDDRFRGQVVTSQEHPDIAVRLVHPRLGTHYYLRRAAGSQ